MGIVTIVLLLAVGGAGIYYSVRHLIGNWREIKARPKGAGVGEIVFNQGLSLVWFGYLLAFFVGLIVNNLIFK